MNYFPNAKQLALSIKNNVPDSHCIILVTDETPFEISPDGEGFDEVWSLEDIADEFGQDGLPDLEPWVFGHTIMELSTAVKGAVLKKLLHRQDCKFAVFLDPDCVVYSNLDIVFESLETKEIALTPHVSKPHLNQDWIKFELNVHRVGVFNLGFLAVKNTEGAKHFAEWWWHRLSRHCVIDEKRHLFTDQKWIDLVPAYFDNLIILRSSTLNIARWNTYQRNVTLSKDGIILADGRPVDFIHYSGFFKIGSQNMGLYDVASRPWTNDKSTLDKLSDKYAELLASDQMRERCKIDWKLNFYKNGTPILDEHRRIYKYKPNLWKKYPQPFTFSNEMIAEIDNEIYSLSKPTKLGFIKKLGGLLTRSNNH